MVSSTGDSPAAKQLLGEILVKRNRITPEQLNEALAVQRKEAGFIGEILVKLGYLDERDIVVALVVQCSVPYIAVNKYEIDPKVLALIPESKARALHAIPLDRVGDVLSVVMVNPLGAVEKNELEQLTGCKIATFIATRTEIDEAIARWYRRGK